MWIDIFILILLLGFAVGLILMEIFLLPGITVAGAGGAIFAAGGVAYAYLKIGPTAGHLSIGIFVVVFSLLFIWLLRSRAFDKIALKTDIDGKLATPETLGIRSGDTGITLSRLNPVGKIKVNGITAEGKSQGELIPENTPVIVFRVESNTVIVKPLDTSFPGDTPVNEKKDY